MRAKFPPTINAMLVARTVMNPRRMKSAGTPGVRIPDGHTYAVDRPEIVPMHAVEAYFSVSEQRSSRLFGADECLRVRTTGPEVIPVNPGAKG